MATESRTRYICDRCHLIEEDSIHSKWGELRWMEVDESYRGTVRVGTTRSSGEHVIDLCPKCNESLRSWWSLEHKAYK